MRFRELRPQEIECRVGTCSDKGASLLLYKTARVDADILDETVGSENWQCGFYECKGTLFCKVGVQVEGNWVCKDDAGAPSNMESEKGEASDAFKRACFKWGIGRELYSAPFIWVPASKLKRHSQGKNGKWQCFDRFDVTAIEYESGKVSALVISNESGIVYTWQDARQSQPKPVQDVETKQRDNSKLNELVKRMAALSGSTVSEAANAVVTKYGNPKEMSDGAYKGLLMALQAEVSKLEGSDG